MKTIRKICLMLTFAFVAILTAGAGLFFNANAADGDPTLKIVAKNISLNETVYILYAVDTEGVANPEDITLEVSYTDPDEQVHTYMLTPFKTDEVLKTYTCALFSFDKLSAKQMTEVVTAKAVYGEVEGAETTYSIRQYALSQFEDENCADDIKDVLTKMLDYGAAAQKAFNYRTDALANDDIIKYSVDWTWEEDASKATASYTCYCCGAEYTDTVESEFVSTTADCDTAGVTTYQATATLNGKTYTATKDVEVENYHNYVDGTCSECGKPEVEIPSTVGMIFEAEDCVYQSADGIVEGEELWGSKEENTQLTAYNGNEFAEISGAWLANGASGAATANMNNNFVAKFDVVAAKAGEYTLFARVQATDSSSLKDVFKVKVNDGDYVNMSNATDVLVGNQQWDSATGNIDWYTWRNLRYWTIAKIGNITLNAGVNEIRISTNNNCPNLDFFYVTEPEETAPSTSEMFDLRSDSITTNGTITKIDTITVKKGTTLGAYSNAVADGSVGYTGLYMRVYGATFTLSWDRNQVFTSYACDVPISESMITGVNYDEVGTYTATVTYTSPYQTFTATFQVVVEE